MPHQPWPFFRAPRNTWFVELNKKQVPLGKHPRAAPPPRKGDDGKWIVPRQIMAEYYRAMGSGADGACPASPRARDDEPVTVAEVLDEYLGWLRDQRHKAKRTVEWYEKYLQSFLDGLEDQLLPVAKLAPRHVTRWLALHPGWTSGRRGAITAVQRALNWSAREGLLKSLGMRSPLAGMEKPPQGRREQLISEAELRDILACVKDQCFRDLVYAAWDTGCRPDELFTVEASFFDPVNGAWVFPLKESKGKRHRRIVYLTDRMVALTNRLAEAHPTGPLFRNADGSSWCGSAAKCRFQRIHVALGLKKVKELGLVPPRPRRLTKAERQDPTRREEHAGRMAARRDAIRRLAKEYGKRYSLYTFRHSACTRMLTEAKLDAVTTAVLMGHRDTTMISRHYAHLAQRPEHLRDAATRWSGAAGS
jgi:integrase